MVKQLMAAGADAAAAANDGSTPRSVAQGVVLAMFVAAEEEARRLRSIAFAMGLQERLGAASVVRGLDPELLRMVVELVYPPVVNVLEAKGEINSDSDSEVDEEGESDEEGASDEEGESDEEEGEGDKEEGGSGEDEGEGGGSDAEGLRARGRAVWGAGGEAGLDGHSGVAQHGAVKEGGLPGCCAGE